MKTWPWQLRPAVPIALTGVWLVACLVSLAYIYGCASTPVRQTQVNTADAIGAVSVLVDDVGKTFHTEAVAVGTPAALRADLAVQHGILTYGQDATKALAFVKTAPNTAAALVAGAPILAEAQAVIAALETSGPLSPALQGKLATLKGKIAALGQ
jgi:hypothetical protein